MVTAPADNQSDVMNRRCFLEIAMAGAAGAAFAPTASGAAKRNLRKAIMYSTIGVKGSVLEKFRAMKEAGFEGVVLANLIRFASDEHSRNDGFPRALQGSPLLLHDTGNLMVTLLCIEGRRELSGQLQDGADKPRLKVNAPAAITHLPAMIGELAEASSADRPTERAFTPGRPDKARQAGSRDFFDLSGYGAQALSNVADANEQRAFLNVEGLLALEVRAQLRYSRPRASMIRVGGHISHSASFIPTDTSAPPESNASKGCEV
jgi:hypothetical protein